MRRDVAKGSVVYLRLHGETPPSNTTQSMENTYPWNRTSKTYLFIRLIVSYAGVW